MDKTSTFANVFPPESLLALKSFIQIVRTKPQVLHQPELAFFKEFLESFGGVVPPAPTKSEKPTEQKSRTEEKEPIIISDSDSGDIEESDVELDNAGVIDDPDQVSNDEDVVPISADVEIDEETVDKANEKKREGISLYQEGDFEKAVQVFTEAIKLNPGMSLLYAKRGQCYLQLRKPNACIRDCTNALKINPDNAAAYKFRGRAHRLLGHWLEAAQDLRSASKIDFDEQVDEWLKEVTPNVRKLEEHKRRYERLRTDREIQQRKKRAQRAREEHEKAANSNRASGGVGSGGGTGGGAAAGATPGGKGDFLPPEFKDLFSDPEIQKAMEDPDVQEAFKDISSNPANMMKYTTNPKIMSLINQLSKSFSKGGAAFPGGFPGGFPGAGGGFPGFGGGPGAPPAGGGGSTNVSDDIGLD